MKTSEFVEQVICAGRREHQSRKTWQCYAGWARRFAVWLGAQRGLHGATAEVKVSSYLAHLATRPSGCSPVTQKQALNALVFAYGKGLGRPLRQMPDWVKPQERRKLPVWLSRGEFDRVTRHLDGACLEIAQLMFGAGPRLNEALKLRIKDIDFDTRMVVIRGGKDDKDRTTCLPMTLIPVLRERMARLHDLWQQDQEQGLPGVWLPDSVARKYPSAGKDWPWQFVFPGRSPSRDPETGIVRRHHLHEDTLAKSLKNAARLARLGKRITVHTLRHSFATAYLENGGSIHKLKELLGHSHLETTEIYTHCITKFASEVCSPLDVQPLNIVPFASCQKQTHFHERTA
jgi:integron integrase